MRFLPAILFLFAATQADASGGAFAPRARSYGCLGGASFAPQYVPQFAPQADFSCQALGICPPASGPIYAPPPVFRIPRAPVYDCPPVQTFAPQAFYAPQAFVPRVPVYSAGAFAAPVYAPGVQLNVYAQSRSRGLLGGLLGGGRLFGGRDRDVFRQRTIVRGRGVAAFGY